MKRYSKGVYGKIAAFLVIFQSAVLHNRLAGIATVGFAPRAHEFNLKVLIFKLHGAEVFKYGNLYVQRFTYTFGEFNPVANYYDIDILGGAVQKDIAHE